MVIDKFNQQIQIEPKTEKQEKIVEIPIESQVNSIFENLMKELENPEIYKGKILIDPKNRSTYVFSNPTNSTQSLKQISAKQKRLILSLHKLLESDIFPVFRIKIELLVKNIEQSQDLMEVDQCHTKLENIYSLLESTPMDSNIPSNLNQIEKFKKMKLNANTLGEKIKVKLNDAGSVLKSNSDLDKIEKVGNGIQQAILVAIE